VAKALLRHGDASYLECITRVARAVGTDPILVVVGPPFGAAVAEHARARGLGVVDNPLPERGMASSIALGFAAMSEYDVDAAWLWPVDHPSVQVATLERLRAALGDHDAALPRFGERGGHPPLVGRALWGALAACADQPGGARSVLASARAIRVDVDDGGVIRDVDTPADRARLSS